MGSASERPPAELVGGRYQLERILGRGGMGVVWQAKHTALNVRFALKFLNYASAQQEATRKRFVTEAQVTAQLKTRHAVQVFDFGVTDDGQPYLVMELLDGESLGERIRRDKVLSIDLALRLLRQAARALDRAHAAGIVHRDLKPENMFVRLDEEGAEELKVMDFGVAKLLGELESEARSTPEPAREGKDALSTFTRTGSLLGTPYYMAPEQINGKDVGPAADIWAFGVVTYECLTGQLPFQSRELSDLFTRIRARLHPNPTALNPDLPEAFEIWFDKACAESPDDRFPTATAAWDALAEALGAHASSPGIEPRTSKTDARAFAATVDVSSPIAAASTPPSEIATLADTPKSGASSSDPVPHDVPSSTAPSSSRRTRVVVAIVASAAALATVGALVVRGRAGPAPGSAPATPPAAAASTSVSATTPVAAEVPTSAITPTGIAPSVASIAAAPRPAHVQSGARAAGAKKPPAPISSDRTPPPPPAHDPAGIATSSKD